jgi:hypothetical protein
VLRGEASVATEVVRFRCADRERCGAAWQVLPAFLARCLWGSWSRVGQTLEANAPSSVPARTRRRWRARLASPARWLVAVLSTATDGIWTGIARAVGLDARRIDLVQGYAERTAAVAISWATMLAELSAALHRLSPGVRLM